MTMPLFHRTPLQEAFAALRRDLIHEDGPRISTMRNYRFAIVQYEPPDEFKLRGEVQRLSSDLVANGWMVLSINLEKLLFERVRRQGEDWALRGQSLPRQPPRADDVVRGARGRHGEDPAARASPGLQ